MGVASGPPAWDTDEFAECVSGLLFTSGVSERAWIITRSRSSCRLDHFVRSRRPCPTALLVRIASGG